jgi:hypothetical protein
MMLLQGFRFFRTLIDDRNITGATAVVSHIPDFL